MLRPDMIASFLSAVLYTSRNQPNAVQVGASGALFSILGTHLSTRLDLFAQHACGIAYALRRSECFHSMVNLIVFGGFML